MSAKPCLVCGQLSPRSRCARHRIPRSSRPQARFRARVLSQTGGACARCGSTENVQAHHLHPLREGGPINGEGVPLCTSCHGKVDAAAQRLAIDTTR